MLDRVLDQRLEKEDRDSRRRRSGVDLDLHDQPVAEADSLNLEILEQEAELLLERYLVLFLVEASAEQRA